MNFIANKFGLKKYIEVIKKQKDDKDPKKKNKPHYNKDLKKY